MQQLLKLLDENHYVSRYIVYEDKVIVRNIFWTHPESIKLFNTFPQSSELIHCIRPTSIGYRFLKLLVLLLWRRLFSGICIFGIRKRILRYMGLKNVQDFVEGTRKHVEGNLHRSGQDTNEFGYKGFSYILRITLSISHYNKKWGVGSSPRWTPKKSRVRMEKW